MATGKRIQFCGAVYHVMSRGNRKCRIYEDHRDRRVWLNIVRGAAERYHVDCGGYTLQHTHYHIVLETPRGNIARFMKAVNGDFAKYFNARHKWKGHLFEGPYKAIVIDDTTYLRAALAYVARNPVEARMVAEPELWQWSSYAAAQGLCEPEPFFNPSWVERAFPAATVDESRRMFAELVKRLPDVPFDGNQFVLADRRTSARVRELIGMTMYLSEIPRAYKALARPDLRQLLTWVTRDERATAVRRAHVVYGYMLAEIARCLAVHPTTITRLLARSRARIR
ncbi:MAG: transposase [Cyanobacteria bacterium]|nr:transposase [Cyanobacteriota bacterium]